MSENKKRIFIVILVVGGLLAGAIVWLTQQNKRPYVTRIIGSTSFYIPAAYLGPKPNDLVEMVSSYIQGQSKIVRFQTSADEILSQLPLPAALMDNSIIWTLEASSITPPHPEDITVAIMPVEDITMLMGLGNNSLASMEGPSQDLTKIFSNPEDTSAFSLTNKQENASESLMGDWITHCIHFRSLRQDDSWGRCSRQIYIKDLILTLYYDGRLAPYTGDITNKIVEKILSWQRQPLE